MNLIKLAIAFSFCISISSYVAGAVVSPNYKKIPVPKKNESSLLIKKITPIRPPIKKTQPTIPLTILFALENALNDIILYKESIANDYLKGCSKEIQIELGNTILADLDMIASYYASDDYSPESRKYVFIAITILTRMALPLIPKN
jgi:hypothetical protein